MKVTKKYVKQVIKEEMEAVLKEAEPIFINISTVAAITDALTRHGFNEASDYIWKLAEKSEEEGMTSVPLKNVTVSKIVKTLIGLNEMPGVVKTLQAALGQESSTLEEEKGYQGWANYETWNVALWINNDQGLYNIARRCKNYEQLVQQLEELNFRRTPDNVQLRSPKLDIAELDQMIREL